jgi:hypothetical protein
MDVLLKERPTASSYVDVAIETDLTDDEIALIEEGMREYDRDPSSFVPLGSVK